MPVYPFPTDLEKYMSARPLLGLGCLRRAQVIPEHNKLLIVERAMLNSYTPRVLYIEDHEDTRELVTLVLEQKRLEVVTVSTIKSGVEHAGSQQFVLYLLDSWLPDGSGLELCRQIREFDKATPILFYSAAAYEMDRAEAIKSGAQAYLIKPSHPSELCSLVTSLIQSHPRLHRAVV